MAQLDFTNIAGASIATPAAGVLSVYSELTGPPAKRLSTKDDAGVVVTYVGIGTTDTITGVKTMTGLNSILVSSSGLIIRNPANTFSYTLTAAAIAAARQLNLPLTTATDTLMCLGLAQTVTGILTLTTPVIGAATGTSLTATGVIRSSGATSGIGYNTGAGGAVVQATSKVTAFTLSTVCGTIQFAADSLAGDTSASATWTNTAIAANDVVVFTHSSGGTLGAYSIACTPGAGTATITIRNNTPGALAEAPIFRFAIIKGVVA
jgi:hypothetical protein